MEELKSLWQDAVGQLRHRYLVLFFWMLIGFVANGLVSGCIGLYVQGTVYQVISMVLSILNVIFVNTIMFLFIKEVRKESFYLKDVIGSLKMFVYHILMGLVLSFLQMLIQEVCLLFGFFAIVYFLLSFFVQSFFFYWNAIMAFAIYDHNRVMKEYIYGGFRMLFVNWKTIVLLSIPYIAVCLVVQYIGSFIYLLHFDSLTEFRNIIFSVTHAKTAQWQIAGMYIAYYGIQTAVFVCLLQVIANLYDRYYTIYLPSGKRR